MMRQSLAVHRLTIRHNVLHYQRWRSLQVPMEKSEDRAVARAIRGLDNLESAMVSDQVEEARPVSHRYELTPAR